MKFDWSSIPPEAFDSLTQDALKKAFNRILHETRIPPEAFEVKPPMMYKTGVLWSSIKTPIDEEKLRESMAKVGELLMRTIEDEMFYIKPDVVDVTATSVNDTPLALEDGEDKE